MKKDWTDVLKQKLDGYVPDDVQLPGFEDIRQKMLAAGAAESASGVAGGAAASRRKPLKWLAYAASLAAVVAGGALLLRNNNDGTESTASLAEAVTENPAATDSGRVYVVESAAEDAAENTLAEAAQANNALAEAAPAKAASAKSSAHKYSGKADIFAPKSAVPTSDDAIRSKNPDAETGNPTESDGADTQTVLPADTQGTQMAEAKTDSDTDSKTDSNSDAVPGRDIYSGGSADPFAEPAEPIRKQLKRFSIGASGILAANGSGKTARKGEGLNVVIGSDGKRYIGMGAPELQYHYTAPVSGGLSLRYQLTNQFYAETGLRFTYLRTWVSPTGAYQNLLYAGIPVGLGCKFVQLGNFDIYGSAYGMASKCIAGSESTNFPYNYVLNEIPVMWSTGVAPGAEYHFGQLVSLYAEPTLSYYFKNEKAPQTLYKENPLYFTLNIGIRFNL